MRMCQGLFASLIVGIVTLMVGACASTGAQPRASAPGGPPTAAVPGGPAAAAPVAPAPVASASEKFVGLWVTRMDYRTEGDVRAAVGRAADLGVTDLMWQVRGQGDAFYRSQLEPWGQELLAAGKTDPGFDPLAVAVDLAHKRGMKIHAWVNIMPLWKGTTPPKDPNHPFNKHPEWRLRDAAGKPQALNEHYVIVNPLLPAVQNHIVNVCKDIVTRYPVDGIHMDYVRFVSDTMKDPAAFPADPQSVAIFEEATKLKWSQSEAVKAAFRDFKRQKITELVRRIKREAVGARPGAVLTAAVWRRPDLARDTYLQDAAAWLNEGTLDRACPMVYTKEDKQFADDVSAWMAAAPGKKITPGLGIYLHTPTGSGSQLDIAGAKKTAGYALFAYASLFESPNPNEGKGAKDVAARAERLKSISADVKAGRGL